MIGRGIFNNIFFFNNKIDPQKISTEQKLKLLLKHLKLWKKTWVSTPPLRGKTKNFAELKKFYKIYISGFPDASDLRDELVKINSLDQTIDKVSSYV